MAPSVTDEDALAQLTFKLHTRKHDGWLLTKEGAQRLAAKLSIVKMDAAGKWALTDESGEKFTNLAKLLQEHWQDALLHGRGEFLDLALSSGPWPWQTLKSHSDGHCCR